MKQQRCPIPRKLQCFLIALSLSIFLAPFSTAQETDDTPWSEITAAIDVYLESGKASRDRPIYLGDEKKGKLVQHIKECLPLSDKLLRKFWIPESSINMNKATSMEGKTVFLVRCELYYSDDQIYLVFDRAGKLLGQPFYMAVLFNQHQINRRVDRNKAKGDTFRLEFTFEYMADNQGIVPLGFVLEDDPLGIVPEDDETSEVSFPINVNDTKRNDWRRDVPFQPCGDTEALLASKRTGDIFRGLFNLEYEKPERLKLALPFLKHGNPKIRARAVAVLSHDPAACNAVLPLREDPDPCVSRTAHIAAVHCDDVEEARSSFKHLLEDMPYPILSRTVFDFKRLRSNDMARFLLQKLNAALAAGNHLHLPDEILERIDTLRREDLAGLGPLLLEAWRYPHDSEAILRCMVRIEDPDIDPILAGYLKKRAIKNDVPFVDLLATLAERPMILEDGVAPIMALTGLKKNTGWLHSLSWQDVRDLATLIMVRWKVPNAFQLVPKIFIAGNSDNTNRRANRINKRYHNRWWGETWCRAMSVDQKRMLIGVAIKHPQMMGPQVVDVLKWDQASETLAVYNDLTALWRAMIPDDEAFDDLSKLLVVHDAPAVDAFLQKALKRPNSIRTASLLMQLLMERQDRPIHSVKVLIKHLAATPAQLPETVLLYRDLRKEYPGEDCSRGADEIGNDAYNHYSHSFACTDVDIQLAALLLLLHWRIEDAEMLFFAHFKDSRLDGLFDRLWEWVPPRHFYNKLGTFAENLSEPYQKRIKALIRT